MTIGQQIKNHRQQRGWTQEHLAQKLCVSRSTVSGWEVGRNYPDLDVVVQISDLFVTSLDSLLREDHHMVHTNSHRTRWFSFYKKTAITLGIISVIGSTAYCSYNHKLRCDERRYRRNLVNAGWSVQTAGAFRNNAYNRQVQGIEFHTYVMPTGLIGVPLPEQEITIFAKRKENVTIELKNKSVHAWIPKNTVSGITNDTGVVLSENGDFLKTESPVNDEMLAKIKSYCQQHRSTHHQIIQAAIEQRHYIVAL